MTILLVHRSKPSRREHLRRARQYADRHHQRLVLVTDRITGWESELVDDYAVVPTTNLDAAIEAALQLASRAGIDAVTTLVEHAVPAAAAVAQQLGLPFVSPKTARLARDKYAMRQAFDKAGLRQPPFELVIGVGQATDAASRIGYPVILKPVLGGGSKYVRRVDNAAELAAQFPTIQRGSWDGFAHDPLHGDCLREYGEAVLLEGFIKGQEICVESLVNRGRTQVVAVHDKQAMDGPYFAEKDCTTPSRFSPEMIYADVDSAHRALGIDIGATHTEFRIGDDSLPVMVETGSRLGGGPIYRSVLTSTGFDLVDAVLDLANGRDPLPMPRAPARLVGLCTLFAEKAGRITGAYGLREIAEHPLVDEVAFYHQIGDLVEVPPEASAAHAHVVFHADTDAELAKVRAEVTAGVRIVTAAL
jgi:biotin carboxylase